MALDSWTDALAAEELGIHEVDKNTVRATQHRQYWNLLKKAPEDEQKTHARNYYAHFLINYENYKSSVEKSELLGKTAEEILDDHLSNEESSIRKLH